MTDKKIFYGLVATIITLAVAVVILVVAGNSNDFSAGAVSTNKPVENYIPVIKQSDGYYSALPIYTTSTFQADGAATLSSTLGVTGTTTLTQSVDGLVVGGTYTLAATGTVITLETNSAGPKYCDADTAYAYALNNGSFAPSLVMSMGTSTGAVATTNLIASTTIATTTTTLLQPIESEFILGTNDKLNLYFADITNTTASSTYFGNWKIEAGVWCQDISI